jgi:YfiH family protein
MDLLSSALLAGFPHGFTTRRGGASQARFGSLNFGSGVGDEATCVEANWQALSAATGLGFARVRQVHGDRVVMARAAGVILEDADAVISAQEGLAACVSVADCVPILIGDPRSGAVAAIHAGWRGTLAHTAERAVEALAREVGAHPGDLLAAIGPAIGPCCYEVSADLAQIFRDDLGTHVAESRGSARVNLWLANEIVLRKAGLAGERIEVLGRCTACEPETFFSHRRDRGRTGRQVGFIAPAPAPLS